jgi:integrase/recombinase XerD
MGRGIFLVFESVFAKEIPSFLELRKANVCPETFAQDRATLTLFDRNLVECDYREKNLSEEILSAWIRTLRGKSKTVATKVLTIRSFVKYLNGMGNHSFLPNAPKVKSDFIPYIYSDEELQSIFHHADNLSIKVPKLCSSHLSAKLPMILRILYGCGTRLGETVALRRKDVNFKEHTILLRETKFLKERLIPVHETLMNILKRYCLAIGIVSCPDAYLFPGAKPGQHFTKRQVETWFTGILKYADIDQREKDANERGACLHSFRHVFVLKSMQQMEGAGHPVNMNDLLLPTYLGHECLLDTDKYMRFSGAQIPKSLEAFETFTVGLIPKVEVPYEDE